MAREYGRDYPERREMATLSDLLGIPHFTASNGGTVRKDFLLAVAERLGVPGAEFMSKRDLIRATWEAAQRSPMPDSKFSPGDTVTNEVLRDIHDGVARHGVPGEAPPAPPAPSSLLPEDDDLPEFDPTVLGDERTRRLIETAQREAQDQFRSAILDAYGGRCAITGFDEVATLQAAHIAPYRGRSYNHLQNGICLRADVHVLFDRGAIAVHESSLEVLVKPHLWASSYADVLRDRTLMGPLRQRDRPSVPALRGHRLWAGFVD
ncbi:HNH endonuclease [Arsenicicoccus cauae]|uniref:HNH endonuclease n=1 Tax=Arsenicicoccus cauae TaxID=2663847 RepID=UPI0018A7DC33|nr:HNH endonuclease [Arsenicicoccus cauae]